MATLTKELTAEYTLSHDELMLKELERRDGIYSFIFHELEAPKVESPLNSPFDKITEPTAPTSDTLKLKTELVDVMLQREAMPIVSACCTQPTSTAPTTSATTSATAASAAMSAPLVPRFIGSASLGALPSIASGLLPAIIATAATTTATSTSIINASSGCGIGMGVGMGVGASMSMSLGLGMGMGMGMSTRSSLLANYPEYLKDWHPPPSLVYDNPKLYAYMANCGFRVRVPTPRFSHISAPLVRNRRHALKETPEYKRCELCVAVGAPDLRELFPHDPDVHAPFVGEASKERRTAAPLK